MSEQDERRSISAQLADVQDVRTLLEDLLLHSPMAYQIYAADGASMLVNPAFRALFGAVPPPGYNVFQDEILERSGFTAQLRRAFAGELVRFPPTWYDPHKHQTVAVEKPRRVAVEVTLFPLRDTAGVVRHVAVATQDVTAQGELQETTEALRISEARYRTQFEAAPEAIVTLDVDRGCFNEVNRHAERLLGYSREQLLTMNPFDISPPTQPDGRSSADAGRMFIGNALAGEPQVFEWVHRNASGQDFPCEIRLVRLPGGANFCRGSIVDISERKHAEAERARLEAALHRAEENLRQSQKMEAIGRLAGGIAHDFNNFLSVILGYTDILLGDLRPEDPMRADLESVRRSGQRAADLTRQLLAFSRQQVLAPRVLDLNDVVQNADKMLRRLLGEDVDLSTRTCAQAARVQVDPGQIDQVIMNLAINARDAMPRGGKLTLETSRLTLDADHATAHPGVSPGPHVLLAVSDTGVGIAPALQSRIFEPFFTTKERGKGTGLGLSTVFGIVQQSGGHLTVYSEPGKGTTFRIYLPESLAPETAAAEPAAPATLSGTETILLVEDQEEVRQVAQEILRRQGYQVLAAVDVDDALRICAQAEPPIALLLTDVVMPRMSGPELAQRLVRLRPDMKVIFMSGYTEQAIVRHGVLDAAAAYLAKPLVPAVLARRVREVLDGAARPFAPR